jgi:predicted nucleotidyltransferase
MSEGMKPDPVEVAGRIVAARFPHAACVFAAGSFHRGEATSTSDIDLVAIVEGGDAPFRESFFSEGWPIEAFVHTRESLRRYFRTDAETRTPSLPTMCLEGAVICDIAGIAESIQMEARTLLAAGPPPLSPEEIDDRRYSVTDLLDDFVGCTRLDEGVFIAPSLAQSATDLLLALHGQWTGHGKWLLRALGQFDPARRQSLADAMEAYCARGDKAQLIAFVENLLHEGGGPLFGGYRRGGL